MGVHWKIQLLGGGGGHKKPIQRGNCLKRGAWQERGGGVLEGVDTPMHTMSYPKIIWHMS